MYEKDVLLVPRRKVPASLRRLVIMLCLGVGLVIIGMLAQHFLFPGKALASGTITGTVYLDYNSNGANNTSGASPNLAIDTGVQSVTVTAYDSSGVSVGSATTASNGTYSLSATGTGPYRIEFTNLPSGYYPSQTGTNNATTVRFVPDGSSSSIDLGLVHPGLYSENNPLIATSCFINGNNTGTDDVLVALNYDRSGSVQHIAAANQIGSTWGLAWRRQTKTLFAAAVLKRQTGLGAGLDGTRGNADDISSIYVIDYSTPGTNGEGTIVTAQTINVNSFSGVNVGSNPRNGSSPANDLAGSTTPAHDYDVIDKVGKRGIGGIALSDDGNTLYVVNLNSRQLISLNVSNLNSVTLNSTTSIPDPGCPGGDSYRPWAIRIRNGEVHIGTVCSGDVTQNAQNLRVYVQKLSGGSFSNLDLDSTTANDYIQLYYDRTCKYFATGSRCDRAEWTPWDDTFTFVVIGSQNQVTKIQPLLTDIEFDKDGGLALGILDRRGHQHGAANYSPTSTDTALYEEISAGSIIKVCNSSGSYIPEGKTGCTGSSSGPHDEPTATDSAPGAAGIPATFYENYTDNGGDGHGELFFGGLTMIPGAAEIVATMMNPEVGYYSGGWRWMSSTTGADSANYTLYTGSAGTTAVLGKANGLGDTVILTDPAPLQIGNRVWTDTNANGVQDPSESGIQNVSVQLWADTDSNGSVDTKIGNATTDSSGTYVFGGTNSSNIALCNTTTLTVRTNASANDAEESSTGTVTTNSGDLDIGNAQALVGMRFTNVTIPQGAVITSASLTFTADGNNAGATVNIIIQGEATDNSTAFSASANNISTRTRTTASVNWNNIGDWTNNTTTNAATPSLTTIIQEIVDRSGWASGNSLNIIMRDNSSTDNREAYSFDGTGTTTRRPTLTVTYTCYSLNPDTAYEIRIPNASGGSKQAALGTSTLVTANTDPGTNGDVRDSDASLSTTTAVISLTTGDYGENNHTYDFGFSTATVTYSAGNRVWYDTDNDGTMDTGEVGVSGVTVDLLNSSNTQIATTTTNADGYYRFDGISSGTGYRVRIRGSNFLTGGVLYGYQNSGSNTSTTDKQDNGVDPSGNNPSTSGVLSSSFNLGAALQTIAEPDFTTSGNGAHGTNGDVTDTLTIDFGFYSITIGNLVFDDINKDGDYDSGGLDPDVPIRTAVVRLYQTDGSTEIQVGPDGILGTSDDATGGVSTGTGGTFQFSGLPSGSYVIKVTPPSGYKSTTDTSNSGTPNSDSDNDDNGTGTSSGTVTTGTITLTAGGEPTLNNSTGASSNQTFDFGFAPDAPTAVRMNSIRAGSVSGAVLLEWETGLETDNLGFNIYREENGQRIKINNHLIAGSAISFAQAETLRAERHYLWWDNSISQSSYWIESLDLKGRSEWHGPINTSWSSNDSEIRSYKRSPYLTEIASANLASRQVERTANLESAFTTSLQSSRASLSRNVTQRAETASEPGTVTIRRSNLANTNSLKISINQEGWYRISQRELLAAGLSPANNPRTLQLYLNGRELPLVVNGEADGRFDESDSIEFYGQGLDLPETDKAVYWLTAGVAFGRRINSIQATASQSQRGSYACTIEKKDRTTYFASLLNGEAENFFGAVIYTSEVRQDFQLNHLDTEFKGNSALEVAVQGVSETPHEVKVALNGRQIGSLRFNGLQRQAQTLSVDSAVLREGINTVTLISSGASDVSLADYVRLTYQRLYHAENDSLRFIATGGQSVQVDGFSTNQVRLFDVTDSGAMTELIPAFVKSGESYSLLAQIHGTGQRHLIATGANSGWQPVQIKRNTPSNWRFMLRGGGADLVIVTTAEMMPAAQSLKSLRQSEGLSVAIIEIEDVYDEFNDGMKSGEALKHFLRHTQTNWKRRPSYALLLGDASYDPRNYLSYGDRDLIPGGRIDTEFMETISDDWLADVNDDGVADLAIGRLPAINAQEAVETVSKIVSYAQTPSAARSLLVSDENDSFDYAEANRQLKSLLPASLPALEIQRGQSGASARTELLEQLNQGVALVNYSGHGSATVWRGGLFNTDDARALTNKNGLGLFIMMNCQNGYLTDPAKDSLAEALLKNPRGGAIAAWASSGFTSAVRQFQLNRNVLEAIFKPGVRLGDATRTAKQGIRDADVRRTWILFGDPTMRLKWQ